MYINAIPEQYGKWAEKNQQLGEKISTMADEMGKLKSDNMALQTYLNATTARFNETEARNNVLQASVVE
jgi:small-conductance mechanosensitive channel